MGESAAHALLRDAQGNPMAAVDEDNGNMAAPLLAQDGIFVDVDRAQFVWEFAVQRLQNISDPVTQAATGSAIKNNVKRHHQHF